MPRIPPRSQPKTKRSAAAGDGESDAGRIRAVLGRSPHFTHFSSAFLDRVAGLGRIQRCSEGDLIHAAWQPVHKLWVVVSGALRVTEVNREGEARTSSVLGEGSYFAIGSLVENGALVRSEAHAIGDTAIAVFDLAQMEREFGADPVVQQYRRLLLYQRVMALADLHRDALTAPLPQRLARRLLAQALAAGHAANIELRLPQADLAAMVGVSRSRVNAELRRLQAVGVLTIGYRRIVIHDVQWLRAAAAADVMPL